MIDPDAAPLGWRPATGLHLRYRTALILWHATLITAVITAFYLNVSDTNGPIIASLIVYGVLSIAALIASAWAVFFTPAPVAVDVAELTRALQETRAAAARLAGEMASVRAADLARYTSPRLKD